MITFINNSKDPFHNLAFEEHIFSSHTDDDVFLLWQNSPAIVVGSYQNILREVHIRKLMELGIPVLRRISGGGTVYHDHGNLNYTYMTSSTGSADYERCMAPVIKAMNELGIPAEKTGVCDISIDGRKISGSAQRIMKNRVLHHGTLLFDSDLKLLDELTTGRKNDSFVSKSTVSAICRVTNIRDHLKEDIGIDQFREKLLDRLVPRENRFILSSSEEEIIKKVADEKYRSWKWTWGSNPPFTYDKSGVFQNEEIHVSYKAKKGIISEASVKSPLVDQDLVSSYLEGSKLDPEYMMRVCRIILKDHADELMDMFM